MAIHQSYHPDPQLRLQALLAERQRLLAQSAALMHEEEILQAQARQRGPGQTKQEMDAGLWKNAARLYTNAEALKENAADINHVDPRILQEESVPPPPQPISQPSQPRPRVAGVIAILIAALVVGIVIGMIVSR